VPQPTTLPSATPLVPKETLNGGYTVLPHDSLLAGKYLFYQLIFLLNPILAFNVDAVHKKIILKAETEGNISHRVMTDLWWTKWHWGSFLPVFQQQMTG
jgi:hypothetical protein